MCFFVKFTRAPVARDDRLTGNRFRFCQVDFGGSCVPRNLQWIFLGGFSIRLHLRKKVKKGNKSDDVFGIRIPEKEG